MNRFLDNFWSSTDEKNKVNTTTFNKPPTENTYSFLAYNNYFSAFVKKDRTHLQSEATWYRSKYFVQILSDFGGLASSILAFFSFFIRGWHTHAKGEAMLDMIYGEAEHSRDRKVDQVMDADTARDIFES